MSYIKFFIPLIIFLFISIFLWRGLQQDPHYIPSPLIGKALPDFDYPQLTNNKSSITNKDFLGHVSLLNVWATWCISCRAEHPILMDIARSRRVILYGLNYKDQREMATTWLKQKGDPYRKSIYDSKGTLGIDLGVYGTPETFLIDQKGVIRYKYVGPISPDVWENEILPRVKKLT